MEDYRISKWTFDTSAGLGLGFGVLAMSGGMISLKDPGNKPHHFHYGGFGIGFSRGLSLKKIEIPESIVQNYVPSGSGSLASFPSTGIVYMTKAFKRTELTEADICGMAAYVEIGGGVVAGYAGTLMFLGLNQSLVLPAFEFPQFAHLLYVAISQAPAVLFMRGASMGPQAGVGVNGMLGMLH
ncbi:conserved membrane hypothetical protein [Paraburkholderia piptadeniae]|uniref:Uncharacterized protein n=1 Tax=Paraburkholderia piptadeniae TaxID=1701573 RepID=A0A1N7S7E8_9BURK|nr:hypothetical protein [Paraburkholderia piptadeniae]SIT42943.1 conserved membrane hypothetical protein [Paraburkholderia piptadeniae]